MLEGSNKALIIEFLKRKGLLRSDMACVYCDISMTWVKCAKINDGFRWKCMNKTCSKYKTTLSIRTGSPFNDLHSSLKDIILGVYRWSTEASEKMACAETGLSRPTMVMIYRTLRDICRKYFVDNPIRLGGSGVVCQVDESLFAYKPKYHRGRSPEEEKWVSGIIDTSFTPAQGYM